MRICERFLAHEKGQSDIISNPNIQLEETGEPKVNFHLFLALLNQLKYFILVLRDLCKYCLGIYNLIFEVTSAIGIIILRPLNCTFGSPSILETICRSRLVMSECVPIAFR